MTNPLIPLAQVAERELGNGEAPRGSNTGAQISKYLLAGANGTSVLKAGEPWCADFVSWCVQKFLASPEGLQFRCKAPHISTAFGLTSWARANGALVFTPAQVRAGVYRHQRGDIVVYAFSHCGIVAAVHATDTNFSAVEGNSNDDGSREGYEVVCHPRTLASVASGKGQGVFIRLTPVGTEVRG